MAKFSLCSYTAFGLEEIHSQAALVPAFRAWEPNSSLGFPNIAYNRSPLGQACLERQPNDSPVSGGERLHAVHPP